jgi:phage terminase large subunit
MAEQKIKATRVFQMNYEAFNNDKNRFIINVGGSRSSKTYSLCQLLIIHCLNNPKTIVSIVRKTFPTLRATVMRDMITILREMNIYQENAHNKTENIYNFENGSYIQFFSCDDEQKLRGRQHDIVWANEANELDFEDFQQLNMRTTGKMIFDFNPSDLFSWLNTLLERDNAVKIHSTYKDNPFLNQNQINEIEALKDVDENYYKIYALGLPATAKSTIFTHWKVIDVIPEKAINNYKIGIDFGYTHPTSVVKVYQFENEFYIEQLLMESKLTAQDLVIKLNEIGVKKDDEIYADSARPEIIEDIKKVGYNIKGANKNVKEGIDYMKSNKLFILNTSIDLIKEFKMYKYKTNGDIVLEEPVKAYDDGIDSTRYACIAFKINKEWDYDIISFSY